MRLRKIELDKDWVEERLDERNIESETDWGIKSLVRERLS